MKNTKFIRVLAFVIAFIMLIGMMPVIPFAASIEYDQEEDDYYKVISQKEWELAPGIVESEIVINNDAGDRRQVMHVVEVDINNEYTKVIPSSKGMIPTAGQYGVQTMDKQAAFAEANGYGNVVAAMNISLSWYDSSYYDQHPELVGEPLGYLILDGVQYTNSQGKTSGAQTCLVINFDEKDGVARPSDIPKTQIRSTADAITGWEEQVIPANFGFLVKDGKMVNTKEDHTSEGASRSMLGIKADGSIIMVMNDGRQAPYSTGFNSYEMSEAMLKLGCVYAINGDGGGSSQFLSQRPGEEFAVNCSPSDGALRATTHGVLVISTAPSTGEFVRAHVEAEHAYYTPGSSVQFTAVGADLAGAAAEIPEEAYWQLSDASYGSIDDNGLFVSNGTVGEVTAQLVYNGAVKGNATINIVNPDAIAFGTAAAYTVPFGESITINVTATYGIYDVAVKASDYTITFDDHTLGNLDGNTYTAGNTKGTTNMTVTLNSNASVTKTIPLTVGKGSEVIFSFEEGTAGANLDNWVIKDHEGKYTPYSDISIVTSENGMVHNGDSALAVHMPTHQHVDGGEGYNANSITWVGDRILLENATAIGMWIYIPEEATQTEIALNYVWYNDSGVQQRTTPDLCLNDDFNGIESSGWYYLSVPISKSIAYIEDATQVAASQGYKRNFFLKFYVTNSGNAGDESSYSGDIVYYIDDVTVDYSDAVADRVNPEINATYAKNISSDNDVTLSAGITTNLAAGTLNFTAEATDNIAIDATTAKVFVDGKAIPTTYKNGRMTSADVVLGAGVHRIVYEIADTMGNVSRAVRYVSVSGTAAVNVVPQNAEATVALTGSIYWLDVVANNAESIDKITLKLDLDTMNMWQLANAELAYNYDIEYYYASVADKDDNLITIVLTNQGSDVSGTAVIASLPIRVWSYCGNAASSNISPADAWTKGYITAVSVNVEVEYGEVIYKDTTSATFSADKIHIDTEAYVHQYKMDKTYFANNTYHVHSAETIDDKDATCTKSGYTGRTFCAVCNSVVEWGTTIKATGHNYVNVDGVLKCACGDLFNGELNGATYIDGVIAEGWINETYYYVNGVFLTGSHLIDDIMCTFDENGVYLPDYKYDGFYEINDTVMYFVNNNYLTGMQRILGINYNFDEKGLGYDGKYNFDGYTCLFDDGVSVVSGNVKLAGICGENAHFVLTTDGVMTITGEGDMANNYTTIGLVPWYDYTYRSTIKKVVIGKDITSIGQRAFINSPKLSEVVFEEGSKLKAIHAHVFNQCPALVSITLPEGLESIGEYALGCSFESETLAQLKQVYLPASVTEIHSNAFEGHHADLVLTVAEDSYAEQFAKTNDIAYTYSHRTFGGTITSVIGEADNIQVQLIPEGTTEVAYQTVVKGLSAGYSLENVAVGTYTLKVIKANHMIAASTVIVSDENATADVALVLGNNDKQFKINSAYLVLSKDINVIYRATLPEGFTNPRMVFTFNDEETVVTTYTVDAQGRYCYEFPNVNPQKMGDIISATLYATVDGVEVSVSVLEYSVRQYCVNQLTKNPDDANLKRMISDLLVYGAKTQIYQNYKVDELVTDGLDLTPSVFSNLDDSYNKQVVTGTSDPNVRYSSAKLQLSNNMIVLLGISTTDPTPYTFEVTINGETTVYTSEDLTYQNGKYYLSFEGVKATQFNEVITAVIKKDGIQISQTLNYSVNTYIQKNQNAEDEALSELLKAIYNYGESAKLYAN